MTILTIITNSNDHTVYFKEPIKNFQYIKLISCSLYNSWINLKENGKITIIDENQVEKNYIEISPGHHTPESMLYFFKNLSYFSQNNSLQGILVLPNTGEKNLIRLNSLIT